MDGVTTYVQMGIDGSATPLAALPTRAPAPRTPRPKPAPPADVAPHFPEQLAAIDPASAALLDSPRPDPRPCQLCGRQLHALDSVRLGIGPECRRRAAGPRR